MLVFIIMYILIYILVSGYLGIFVLLLINIGCHRVKMLTIFYWIVNIWWYIIVMIFVYKLNCITFYSVQDDIYINIWLSKNLSKFVDLLQFWYGEMVTIWYWIDNIFWFIIVMILVYKLNGITFYSIQDGIYINIWLSKNLSVFVDILQFWYGEMVTILY